MRYMMHSSVQVASNVARTSGREMKTTNNSSKMFAVDSHIDFENKFHTEP